MSTLTKIVSRWGLFKGIKFYYDIKQNKKRTWTLPELKHPVHLRPHTSDNLVFKQIFGMGEYDITFPQEPKNIIDGGGNIGLFAIIMANRYPKARIISIEPDTGNYAQLVKNTSAYPNIIPIHAGLWNKNCKLEIVDMSMDEWGLQVRETQDERGMQAITIGELMELYDLPTVDVVKLDVEGAEAAIFSDNYQNWLGKTRMLIIELHEKYWPGTSANFEKAIQLYPATVSKHGEYLIYTMPDTSPEAD